MKHTPGPWHVVTGASGFEVHCARGAHRVPHDTQLAYVLGGSDPVRAESDAQLMAAAPDLLAALKDAAAFMEAHFAANKRLDKQLTNERMADIRAALTKAGL